LMPSDTLHGPRYPTSLALGALLKKISQIPPKTP
jgi:hypothetical protein